MKIGEETGKSFQGHHLVAFLLTKCQRERFFAERTLLHGVKADHRSRPGIEVCQRFRPQPSDLFISGDFLRAQSKASFLTWAHAGPEPPVPSSPLLRLVSAFSTRRR
jgi:hypothetical protein